MDPLIGGILRSDPDAVVAFVHDRSPTFGEVLRRRWQETLQDVQERLLVLPRRSADGYVRLLASADVLLDTPHFGGANTAYDAYLAAVPVVTLPGEAPRSRYTAALHQEAGVEGCTARTPEEYVSLSVRLGTDPRWRKEVSAEMAARAPRLFERPEPAAELASFLEDAVRRAWMSPGSAEATASSP
jgi:predicted O-linked N-acetylglucosamine transferase (SPINDLY family)